MRKAERGVHLESSTQMSQRSRFLIGPEWNGLNGYHLLVTEQPCAHTLLMSPCGPSVDGSNYN
jgi:hypothetical protein